MMKAYEVSANGTVFGTYTSDSEQGARDLCARDAGYESEADMVDRLEHRSELEARAIFGDGDRVEAGEGEDRDTGRIESLDGAMAYVSWDSGVKTPCPVADLHGITRQAASYTVHKIQRLAEEDAARDGGVRMSILIPKEHADALREWVNGKGWRID